MYQLVRSRIVHAIANRPHAFTVCLGLFLTSILMIYNGLVDVPDSPRAGTEPVVIVCLLCGFLGLPLCAWVWLGRVDDAATLEAVIFVGLAAALGVTVWTEYQWPDVASGTLGYAMLILLAAGALLRNEFVLGAFLIGGMAAWFLAEGSAPRAADLPPDNRTLILASAAIAFTFHVSLRFERHVQADLTRQLVDQIRNDALTGVLSREGMVQLVENKDLLSGRSSWCLYADVDFFKSINDEFGHDRGDDVLRAVAGAIVRSLGPAARVARWGGDEFVAIGQDRPPAESEVEDRINRELEEFSPGPRVTVGIATLTPEGDPPAGAGSARLAEELVKSADRQMYARRNQHRGDTPEHVGRNP